MAVFVFFSRTTRATIVSSNLVSPFWLLCITWTWARLRLLWTLAALSLLFQQTRLHL